MSFIIGECARKKRNRIKDTKYINYMVIIILFFSFILRLF